MERTDRRRRITILNFPPQPVGYTSSALTITLSDTGDGALAISSISASGDFSQTNNCGATVSASAACTIAVTFTPLGSGGTSAGALIISDNAPGSPQTVALSGTGSAFTAAPHPAAAPTSAPVKPPPAD